MTEHTSMARLAFEHQTENSNKNKKTKRDGDFL
jgi:hypothetical protein